MAQALTNQGLWDHYMKCYDLVTMIEGYQRSLADIATQAQLRKGALVLDAGSGTGNLSILLASQGATVIGCDRSRSALRLHRQKDSAARAIRSSLEDPLPFQRDCFDVICCASVLFALSQAGCHQALKEFYRVLRPGGRLVVTVGKSSAGLIRLSKLYLGGMVRKHGVLPGALLALRHATNLIRVMYYNKLLRKLPDWEGFHCFSMEELSALLGEAGFEKTGLDCTFGGSFLLATAHKPSRKG